MPPGSTLPCADPAERARARVRPVVRSAGRRGALGLAFAALAAATLQAESLVVVHSDAEHDYVERRNAARADDPAWRERYVVMKGRFFPPWLRDGSLTRMEFTQIARTLAQALAPQGYLPAPGPESADLLLVVHWGATNRVAPEWATTSHDPGNLFDGVRPADPIEGPALPPPDAALPDGVNPEMIETESNDAAELDAGQLFSGLQAHSNASLLGLRTEEATPFMSERERMFYHMAREERYFIIVNAYDQRLLRERGQVKRLWSTRMSLRSPGTNFRIALGRMSSVAGPVFGTVQREPLVQRAKEKRAVVEVGEAVVVELDALQR